MPVTPPRRPDTVRLWSDVVEEARTLTADPQAIEDRRVFGYVFSNGVKKRAGQGPYTDGNPERN